MAKEPLLHYESYNYIKTNKQTSLGSVVPDLENVLSVKLLWKKRLKNTPIHAFKNLEYPFHGCIVLFVFYLGPVLSAEILFRINLLLFFIEIFHNMENFLRPWVFRYTFSMSELYNMRVKLGVGIKYEIAKLSPSFKSSIA